jgi:hypothetical protein
MWPEALDVVHLLATVALARTGLTPELLADRLSELIGVSPPPADLS